MLTVVRLFAAWPLVKGRGNPAVAVAVAMIPTVTTVVVPAPVTAVVAGATVRGR